MKVREDSVDVQGCHLFYEVQGSGHPVLLIHGGLGDRRMWDHQVPALAERYEVIRYDTRGWGRSRTEEVEYAEFEDALAVLDATGAGSAYVVGQSRGGGIALDLALAYPDRVDALVSVAGGVGGYEPELPAGLEPPPWDEMERLWEAKNYDELSELETRVWVDGWGQPASRVDPEIRTRVKGWILAGYQAENGEAEPRALEPRAAERLHEVSVPTMVLIGDADEPGIVAAGRHLADSVKGARSVEFPGVAHMIQLERPAEVTSLLLDFFSEADAVREGSPSA